MMLKSKGQAYASENLMKDNVAVDSLFQLEHFQLQKLNRSHLMLCRSLCYCQGESELGGTAQTRQGSCAP